MVRWRFRTPWWAPPLVAALSALMIWLGCWQLGRGHDKQALLDRYASAAAQPPQVLATQQEAAPDAIVRVSVRGHFDAAHQLLLDNQGHDGNPGYRVWSLLQQDDGAQVLVDRGWVPRNQDREALAPPAGDIEVIGYWRALPRPGLQLAADNCAEAGWPRVVQYPTLDELRCLYSVALAPGLLLMDASQDGGYVRTWQTAPELQPAKHYGYAAQWFAFTATLIAIFLKLGFRRLP